MFPAPNERPAFAQIYCYDTAHELDHRLAAMERSNRRNQTYHINPEILAELQHMLHDSNPFVHQFRAAANQVNLPNRRLVFNNHGVDR